MTWKRLPSVGEPLDLEVSGPSFEPFTLLFSMGRAEIATPQGTLWLDPTSLQIVRQGQLGATGRGSARVLVPSTPALVGTTWYWQALVGLHARYTNLEATTLSDL